MIFSSLIKRLFLWDWLDPWDLESMCEGETFVRFAAGAADSSTSGLGRFEPAFASTGAVTTGAGFDKPAFSLAMARSLRKINLA